MAAMLGGGIVMTLLAIWLVVLIRWDWPRGTEAQRLGILGNALLGTLAGAGLVQLGLVVRNLIRNLRGSVGPDGVSFEAVSHRDGGTDDEGEDDPGPAGAGGGGPAGGLGDLGGGDPAGPECGRGGAGQGGCDRGRGGGGEGGSGGSDHRAALHGEREDRACHDRR
jgi:hypothetical protein